MKSKNPVILIIRDGWGYRASRIDNYIAQANTPYADYYEKNYPHGLLKASGEAVGVPAGFQGNSEVGHMTIGSGRIVFQSLVRINLAIKNGDFFRNKAFLRAINNSKKSKSHLHIIGLIQTQGVHSHINHLFALLDLCKILNFKDVAIHIITDGRDAPITESLKHLATLNKKIKTLGFGRIVSVCGRYYAMDRDTHWERTEAAYDCIASGKGNEFSDVRNYIKKAHLKKVSDEFIEPAHLENFKGIEKNDNIIFFNFRTDRPRQLIKSLVEDKFLAFKRKKIGANLVTMTDCGNVKGVTVAFPEIPLNNLLGEVISRAAYRQLRISETEKFAHVTYFFNGQYEKPWKNEERILIKSPRVATYDLKPEMSAPEIAKRLVEEINKQRFDFIVVNLVNCDMIGHTGKKKEILKGVAAVDEAMGAIIIAGLNNNYSSLILADHGNAEDKGKKSNTSHTKNPVPVILVSPDKKLQKVKIIKDGGLSDVAPTVLKIMNLKKPKEMSGRALY